MSLVNIDGRDLVRSIKAGTIKLEHNRDKVDLLNVFPVPDGDTGTNMFLTLQSAVREGEKNPNLSLGKAARAISMGSLMGARGNSGVIMSQIFRGIARELEGAQSASAAELALAFKAGAKTAYEAVMKPVEGTILTVIREIARGCEEESRKNTDIVAALLAGINAGYSTLEKTPDMLPILKDSGVVDAGGQGLLYFLEGFVEGLAYEKDISLDTYREKVLPIEEKERTVEFIDLEYQYCTELLIKGEEIRIPEVRDYLLKLGDSMLVVGDEDLVKVHIHTNHPGKVLETCLLFGNLSDIKINNMLEEVHEHRNSWEQERELTTTAGSEQKIGLVAVGAGDGVINILQSLGVDIVVEGGQTMNPSTEELLNACKSVNAESIIILPNNKNIIMAAQQVNNLYDKRKVMVVPTKSVMQCITALIAYDPDGDVEEVAVLMEEEIKHVKYAEVTHAVRDSAVNGLTIKEGDTMGIINGSIEITNHNGVNEVVEKVIEKMTDENSELITLFYGQDINEESAGELKGLLEQRYPDYEIEMHYGGQPHYNYLISVE